MLEMNLDELKLKIPEVDKWLGRYEYNSPLTIQKYGADLLLFCKFLELDRLKKVISVTADDINRFMDYGFSQNWSKENIKGKLTVVKIFYNWLVRKGLLEHTQFADAKKIRNSKKVKFTMPIESKDMLISAIKTHSSKNRMLLMVELCLATGLRRSEICNLKISDLKENSIVFYGKGDKQAEMMIPKELAEKIRHYIETERAENMQKYSILGGKDLDYLFVSGIGEVEKYTEKKKNLENGNQINANSFANSLKMFAKKAGILEWNKITPHGLRRLFGTCVYNQTKDPILTQRVMRHSSFETTAKSYIADDKTELNRIANECTPLVVTSLSADKLSKADQIKLLEEKLRELKGE